MLGIDAIFEKVGPGRYHARVEIPVESLTGYDDDILGATAEGGTPGEAMEAAAAKAIAALRGNPELAALLLPLAGPELSVILLASRYMDAPEIIDDVTKSARKAVVKTSRRLWGAAKTAKRLGRGVVKAAAGVGKLIRSLW